MRRASSRAMDRKRATSRPRAALSSAARARRIGRFDAHELDAQEQRALECRPVARHEAPRRLGIAAIQLGLDACQHLAVVLTVKPLVRPGLHRPRSRAARPRRAGPRRATRGSCACAARFRNSGCRDPWRRSAGPAADARPRESHPETAERREGSSRRNSSPRWHPRTVPAGRPARARTAATPSSIRRPGTPTCRR